MQIMIVVVRYKVPINQSATLRTLALTFSANPSLSQSCGVLLWDNSPAPVDEPQLPFAFDYVHSEINLGVSGAYNGALVRAEQICCPWLLLLDQDTSLPEGFLERMLGYSYDLEEQQQIATVVPFIRSNNMLVSPRRFGRWVRNHQIDRGTSGVFADDAYAVNSATLLRTASLREIGGYSQEFWLDLSDAYVFHMLHLQGKQMYIASDLEVPHSIATLDFNANMSVARYRSFLAAESLFVDRFRFPLTNAVHTLWLLARAARQWHRYQNKSFAYSTLRAFWLRLRKRRSARALDWLQELRLRDIPAISNGNVVG